MKETAISALATAIGYPEEVPTASESFVFSVDGGRVEASVERGRLVLVRGLAAAGDVDLAQFAGYAAGRVLREEAVLAYDPGDDRVILWQDVPADADAGLLRRFFEVFAASCDWWLARLDEAGSATSIPEMTIRP